MSRSSWNDSDNGDDEEDKDEVDEGDNDEVDDDEVDDGDSGSNINILFSLKTFCLLIYYNSNLANEITNIKALYGNSNRFVLQTLYLLRDILVWL